MDTHAPGAERRTAAPAPAGGPVSATVGHGSAVAESSSPEPVGTSGTAAPAPPTVSALCAREAHALTRFAYLLTHDLAEAEDLVHDAFLALHARFEALEDRQGALGYVRVCILNGSRTRHRRDTRRRARDARALDRPTPGLDEGYVLAEEHRRIARHVDALPRRQRDVVALRYWQDLSEADIAATLGVSTGTVKSSASRALRTLAAALQREETS